MTIELSQKELTLLDEAIQVWESAPGRDTMGLSLLSCMLIKDKDEAKRENDKLFADSESKMKTRKSQALLLRAKLMQASALASEHEILG